MSDKPEGYYAQLRAIRDNDRKKLRDAQNKIRYLRAEALRLATAIYRTRTALGVHDTEDAQ